MEPDIYVGLRFIAEAGTPSGHVTVGKEYEIAGLDEEGWPYFIDDAEQQNFALSEDGVLRHPDQFTIIN